MNMAYILICSIGGTNIYLREGLRYFQVRNGKMGLIKIIGEFLDVDVFLIK